MSEALDTTAVYTVSKTPFFNGSYADPQTSLSVGQKVKVSPTFSKPDSDGDVKVRLVDSTGSFYYVSASCLTKDAGATVADFPVGTKVRVAADAKTSGGGGVYFGGVEVEGVVIGALVEAGDVHVEIPRAGRGPFTQYVGPAFLTKVEDVEEAPAEEPAPVPAVAEEAVKKAHAFLVLHGDADNVDALLALAKIIQAGI